jgi:hypothetical protein
MAYSSIRSIKRLTLLLKVFVQQQLAIVNCTFLLNFAVGNKSLQNYTKSIHAILGSYCKDVSTCIRHKGTFHIHVTEVGKNYDI